MPITVAVLTVTQSQGLIDANLSVVVPAITAAADIRMIFAPSANAGPPGWREEAYDKALMMLNPE